MRNMTECYEYTNIYWAESGKLVRFVRPNITNICESDESKCPIYPLLILSVYSGTSHSGRSVCESRNFVIRLLAARRESNSQIGRMDSWYVSLTILVFHTSAVSHNGHLIYRPNGCYCVFLTCTSAAKMRGTAVVDNILI